MSRILKYSLLCILFIKSAHLLADDKNYTLDAKKGKTSFPYRLFNNIIIVDVKINDTKTLKFIFDSGCKSTIIIHPKWLDSFEISTKRKVYFSGLGFKDSIETIRMNDSKISIGQLYGVHIPVFILSKDSLSLDHYLGTDVDGIFGAEIFERFYVHINNKNRQIELYEKRPSKRLSNNYTKMPVQMHKSKGYLSCTILNNKNEFFISELLLDTGSNIPVIIKNKEPEDLHVSNYIDAEIGEGLSGPLYSKVSRLKRIFIDTIKMDSVVVAFNETPITLRDMNENTLDGNIGNDILNRLDMYFAYPESAVYIKPTTKIREPFDFNISNIILLENKGRNDGFVVKSIAGNSPPLLAGLQKGDEILKIDRYKSTELSLEDALLLLNKRIGKKITLQFRRSNEIIKINYKLVNII